MIKFRVVELNNGLFEAQIKTIWYEKWYPVRYPSSFVSLDDAIKRMNEVIYDHKRRLDAKKDWDVKKIVKICKGFNRDD